MSPRPHLRRLSGDIFFVSFSYVAHLFILDDGCCCVAFRVAAYALRHVVACAAASEQKYHRYE